MKDRKCAVKAYKEARDNGGDDPLVIPTDNSRPSKKRKPVPDPKSTPEPESDPEESEPDSDPDTDEGDEGQHELVGCTFQTPELETDDGDPFGLCICTEPGSHQAEDGTEYDMVWYKYTGSGGNEVDECLDEVQVRKWVEDYASTAGSI